MNQRLLWNFEFSSKVKSLPATCLLEQEKDDLKWEIRFFWPAEQIVVLNTIDRSLLDLGHYKQKHREDYYYLLPDNSFNIKRRREELLYKPLLKQATQAVGFGAKINLDNFVENPDTASIDHEYLQYMAHQVAREGVEIYVKKEAFIYKFPTTPTIKLELARLEVRDKAYLSACIEGKSLILVETIAEHLLGKQVSCEYVSFLKNIQP